MEKIKIITAIGNKSINEKLSKYVSVVSKDIQYQEGIFEILEEINDINEILLNPEIMGEYDFEELIEKILEIKSNIEIAIFSNSIDSLNLNFLNSKSIYKIYPNNEFGYDKYLDKFKYPQKISSENIKKEIKDLKENITLKSKKKHFIHEEFSANKENKIIMVAGSSNVGKTVFSSMFAKFLSEMKKKTLLIDYDLNSFDLKTLMGNYSSGKVSKGLKYIDFLNVSKCDVNSFPHEEIFKNIDSLKENYDFIIIDTSSMINSNYRKMILEISDKIIFLIEPNLLGIKKAKSILEIFIHDFYINENKINIILNKVNKFEIDNHILDEIFSNYKIIGKINYNEKYNLFINKNTNCSMDKNEYKEIYEKIII